MKELVEKWMPVKNYEGLYMVSSIGNVKSLYFGKEKTLTPVISSTGYFLIRLYKNGKIKGKNAHQLVAEAFLNHEPCGFKLVVDHIDNDKQNNRVENLQVISHRENSSKDNRGGSSKYIGVSFYTRTNKYRAQCMYNNKVVSLGYFNTELEASQAYNNFLNTINN